MVYGTDGERSQYNEADRKMERIHKLQDVINTCRLKLLKYDADSKLYHYEIISSALLSILYEIRGKMSTEEKQKFEKYRLQLTLFFDTKIVFDNIETEGYTNRHLLVSLNTENWVELRKMLFEIEDFTRDTLDLRGFSSFNVDDDEGDTY